MTRLAVLAVPLVMVAASLTGCGLIWGSSHLEDALEAMPGSVDRVTFFDRARAAERVGLGEIDADSSDEEVEEYVETAQEMPWRTDLDPSLMAMLEEAPFTAQDVEWEAVGHEGDDFGRVWKMDDDLDLDDVADELVEVGYQEEDSDGDSRTLTVDLDEIEEQSYLVAMQTLAVIPDEHLVVTGPLIEDVIEVVADDADSAIDTDAFEELRDTTDDVELADLARDDEACPPVGNAVPTADLGRPEEIVFFVHGDEGDARSVLRFGSEEEAEDDAEAREQFLDQEASPITGVPYTELGDWAIETDGDRVLIDIEYDDPQAISGAISRADYLSFCSP